MTSTCSCDGLIYRCMSVSDDDQVSSTPGRTYDMIDWDVVVVTGCSSRRVYGSKISEEWRSMYDVAKPSNCAVLQVYFSK